MFYKGIIIDLDNTLYSYDDCHIAAIHQVFTYIIENYKTQICLNDIRNIYDTICRKSKNELNNTASSHNKSIYFKGLLENLNLSISILDILTDIYWTTFLDNIKCHDGVKDFIIWNKERGVKISVLTDYETEYQIKKLNKLDITEYIDVVVTSEEVGIEKPSVQMFQTVLRRLSLNPDEVIMIGDSFEKDIQGAYNMGIFSYWLRSTTDVDQIKKELHKYKNIHTQIFTCFRELHTRFIEFENELNHLKHMSRRAGERFDLVQAGGGNSSVKVGDWMCIKASGVNMTQIDTTNGYVVIDNKRLYRDIFTHENNINNKTDTLDLDVMDYNVMIGRKRASIETFMHAIFKKYTLHLHPIQVNRILISKNARTIITEMFPEALIIDYLTPGIKLCNAIKDKYNNENIVFLINHGIIITSDIHEDIYIILENILSKFETYQELDFNNYKYTNNLSAYVNSTFNVDNVSFLCQNSIIIKYFIHNPNIFKDNISFPDALIYCGIKPLFVEKNLDEIKTFYDKYNEIPKIIIINDCIYINAISLSKCRDIEEVLLSNLMILDSNYEKNYLADDEICFLNNWDAEKYRKIL